ncbi:MAG: amidohydrolase [Planctomycetes bacterium]|nr:amidohydrolase [Planctomycetota bacterium]
MQTALLAAVLLAVPLHALAQERAQDGAAPQAFVGARLVTLAGAEIENGILVVRDGVIAYVGPLERTPVPAGAVIHDVSGRTILPGLVDTHSHIGAVDGGDRSQPLQPEVRVLDSIDVLDPSLARARAGGITTVNVMPGSGHLLSGQTAYIKLRKGHTIEELAMRNPDGTPAGGIKMANGTNSRRDPPFPGTRAKSAALVREKYVAAQEYARKLADPDPKKQPERDLGLEALGEVLSGKRMVHHHTHRHDDILTVLRLREEFGFRVVLHHVSDAWKVADEIAAAKVPCSLIVIDSPGGKLEARDMRWESARVLSEAGVDVCFHTDDPITDSRLFLRSAALAARAGLARDKALAGVTLAGARMLDLATRVGSLEVGKDADFVILDGDPLSVYAHVLETWVEGQKVFDLNDPRDRLFAVGGVGAGSPRALSCCEGEEEEVR